MNHTLIIFSSTKSLRIAERIKATLEHALHVTIWNQGFFDHSRLPPVWTFLKHLMCYDFAAIVLGADDMMAVTEESLLKLPEGSPRTIRVPKDNVVFELGAVMARIGPQKTFIFKPREPVIRIPSYFDTSSSGEIKEGSDIEKITHFLLYNHAEDFPSIDRACQALITRIEKMARQDTFHSDLPSQGLAYGYLNNFVLPVCRKLSMQSGEDSYTYLSTPEQIISWLPGHPFTLTIVIPSRIMKREEVLSELEKGTGELPQNMTLIRKEERGEERLTGIFALRRPSIAAPLHIIDIPTTLQTSRKVIDQLDEYWLKDNSQIFTARLERREILNFRKTLEYLCVESEEINSQKIFIISPDQLESHIKKLEFV